jgi:hypothetical protein
VQKHGHGDSSLKQQQEFHIWEASPFPSGRSYIPLFPAIGTKFIEVNEKMESAKYK